MKFEKSQYYELTQSVKNQPRKTTLTQATTAGMLAAGFEPGRPAQVSSQRRQTARSPSPFYERCVSPRPSLCLQIKPRLFGTTHKAFSSEFMEACL